MQYSERVKDGEKKGRIEEVSDRMVTVLWTNGDRTVVEKTCLVPSVEPFDWVIHKDALRITPEMVSHPAHYGGADDPYEAIKVIEAWGLSFSLGSVLKYICRRDKKGAPLEDLKKARWYLDREIQRREKEST